MMDDRAAADLSSPRWDRGLLGMAVGGKRRLTVPPKLAYGRKGCSPDIPPDSALNFLVTMKAID